MIPVPTFRELAEELGKSPTFARAITYLPQWSAGREE